MTTTDTAPSPTSVTHPGAPATAPDATPAAPGFWRSPTVRKAVAALLAFAAVSVLVIRTSEAAFTATAGNQGSSFLTATITLDGSETVPLFGDTSGGALVDTIGLVPGAAVTGCLEVAFGDTSGTLTATDLDAVQLELSWDGSGSAVAPATPGDLAAQLQVAVDVHEAGCVDAASGDGPVLAGSNPSGSVTGFGPADTAWTPDGDGDTVGYLFSVSFASTGSSAGDDALQGASVSGVDLTWSVQTSG